VLQAWQGLGYNRRAVNLQRTAREVINSFYGRLPSDPEVLRRLPGVGHYTAGAVAAIAFDIPAVFMDTNIRAVFHYFFFPENDKVSDRDLLPLVEATLDRDSPREWYYALFDYGAMLKTRRKEPKRTGHRTQGAFHGSDRELRGRIVRLLLDRESVVEREIVEYVSGDESRVKRLVSDLCREGLVEYNSGIVRIRQE
jgi:A/G-specific adenine glycosylase